MTLQHIQHGSDRAKAVAGRRRRYAAIDAAAAAAAAAATAVDINRCKFCGEVCDLGMKLQRAAPPTMCHTMRHTSHVTRHTSHVTRHTSHVTRHTSHVTRHTSHVTRHTSHVKRQTSHVTRHTSQVHIAAICVTSCQVQLTTPVACHLPAQR